MLAVLLVANAAPAADLYGVSFNASNIYKIDTTTATLTLVGSTGLFDLAGLAFDDAGTLYAIDIETNGSTQLYVVDPVAGASTAVGPTGFPGAEGGLVFDASSHLFYSRANVGGFGGLTQELITIDPGTGAGTSIGNLGLNAEADVSGMALLADGTLIAYDPQSAEPDRLLSIDALTGVASVIGPTADTTVQSLGGLAVDPDTGAVFLSNGPSLFQVDPGTGAPTLIGSFGDVITGLTFAPATECILGTDPQSTLFDFDPTSAVPSNPRPMGIDGVGGLAKSPAGILYALRDGLDGELYSVDAATGASTLIGATGVPIREGGLAFDPISGQLFGGHGNSGGDLFTFDILTGGATFVGTVIDEFGQTIDLSALAFDAAGTLYGLKSVTAPEIYRIDPNNANVLDRVPIPGYPAGTLLGGMAFDDSTGILYASIEGSIVELNPTTGATIPIGVAPLTSSLEVVSPCNAFSTVAVPTLGAFARAGLAALLGAIAIGFRSLRLGDPIRSPETSQP